MAMPWNGHGVSSAKPTRRYVGGRSTGFGKSLRLIALWPKMEDWMKFGTLSGDGGVLMTDCWAEMIDPPSRRRDTA